MGRPEIIIRYVKTECLSKLLRMLNFIIIAHAQTQSNRDFFLLMLCFALSQVSYFEIVWLISFTNYRYTCVYAQYLVTTETKFQTNRAYWMISKCDPTYPNNKYRALCENPGHKNSTDSIVPVTDYTSKIVYRNIYCLYCSTVDANTPIILWELKTANNIEIDSTDKNFWYNLKSQGGNVLFRPPAYIPMETCDPDIHIYHISTCNETGLWQIYNRTIERACESYTDPFNLTFKNYFCYLCNTAEKLPLSQWKCRKSNRTYEEFNLTPPFSAIIDIKVLQVSDNTDRLFCKHSQFPDRITVSKQYSWVFMLAF